MPARLTIDWDTVGLGTMSDPELALRLGCGWLSVRRAREARGLPAFGVVAPKLIDWDAVEDLGVSPDAEIARRLGVHPASVLSARRTRGIPAPAGNMKGIDWDKEPLGRLSDKAVADALGVHPSVVWRARTRRGIPPWSE